MPESQKLRISDSELAIAREKVLRAHKHLQICDRVVRRFIRNDCGIDTQFNPKTNEFDVLARLPDPPPIVGMLVGDCVHNLRSALDHVVYALIATNPAGSGGTPTEKAMFPICDTQAGYAHQVHKLKRLDGAPDAVAALIDSAQPYHLRESGSDHTLHPLWVLNKLENIDKHRRLTLACGIAQHALVSIRYRDGGETDVAVLSDMIYDRAILTSYPPGRDGSEVQVNGGLMAYIALREAKELASLLNQNVIDVLEQLANYVGNNLLPKFRRLATGHAVTPARRRRQDLRPRLPRPKSG